MEIEINYLNNNGIGITLYQGKKIFTPYTLAGEIVRVEIIEEKSKFIRANLLEVIRPSPERVAPPCKYFIRCGGCSLQHMNKILYEKFKFDLYKNAIENIGFSSLNLVAPFFTDIYNRRRTSLKAILKNNVLTLGYFKNHTHEIINIDHCSILEKKINDLVPFLYQALSNFNPIIVARNSIEISITLCDNGIDLILKSTHQPGLKERKELIKLTEISNVIRIYWQASNTTEIITKTNPIIKFADQEIFIPINVFLQVSNISQEIMIDFIIKNIKPGNKVIDLYAGCGTYSVPIANIAKVHAVDGDKIMIESIKHIVANLTTECRDLYKNPIKPNELESYDVIIINPPRNGAETQIRSISRSNIDNVILVSCDLNSLIRDAKILKESGFLLTNSLAIDQFYYTSHLEVITVFSRC